MTKTILALLAILSLNASAYAAEIDPKLSSFTWRGSKITGDYHAGQVSPESSSLTLVAGKIESGEVVFAMNSITVSDLDGEWKDKFLGHIKGADFFDVSKFPTTTLKLSSIPVESHHTLRSGIVELRPRDDRGVAVGAVYTRARAFVFPRGLEL